MRKKHGVHFASAVIERLLEIGKAVFDAMAKREQFERRA